jgi:hypothetical protein
MRRIYHYHIRKTGGTSLNESFFELTADDPSGVSEIIRRSTGKVFATKAGKIVGANLEELQKNDYFYGFSHYPCHKYAPEAGTFTVTIFRDPVERFVSHYKMLVGMIALNISRPWLKVESGWIGDSVVEFAENIPKERLLNQLYTFSREMDVAEALDNISKLSHVIFNDKYAEGMFSLSSMLDVPLKMRRAHAAPLLLDISPRELRLLRDFFFDENLLVEKIKRKRLL